MEHPYLQVQKCFFNNEGNIIIVSKIYIGFKYGPNLIYLQDIVQELELKTG